MRLQSVCGHPLVVIDLLIGCKFRAFLIGVSFTDNGDGARGGHSRTTAGPALRGSAVYQSLLA